MMKRELAEVKTISNTDTVVFVIRTVCANNKPTALCDRQ